jgi:hypothetical protein
MYSPWQKAAGSTSTMVPEGTPACEHTGGAPPPCGVSMQRTET